MTELQRLARAVRSRRIDEFTKPFDGVRNTIGRFDSRGCFRIFVRVEQIIFTRPGWNAVLKL